MYILRNKQTLKVVADTKMNETLAFNTKLEAKCWIAKHYSFDAIYNFEYIKTDKITKSIFD